MGGTITVLTKEEEHRIRGEEIFRHEVRLSLENHSSSCRAWRFLNSPLGIWVLSSIVVGVLSVLYTRWENHKTKIGELQAVIHKLDTEIIGRIDLMDSTLKDEGLDEIDFGETIRFAYSEAMDRGVFGDLQKCSLRGLILQLNALVPRSEKKDVRNALDAIERLKQLYPPFPHRGGVSPDPNQVHEVRTIVEEELWISRWR